MEKEKKKNAPGAWDVSRLEPLFIPYRPLPSPPPLLLIYVDAGFVGELLWYYGRRLVVLPVKLKFVSKIIKKEVKRLTYARDELCLEPQLFLLMILVWGSSSWPEAQDMSNLSRFRVFCRSPPIYAIKYWLISNNTKEIIRKTYQGPKRCVSCRWACFRHSGSSNPLPFAYIVDTTYIYNR